MSLAYAQSSSIPPAPSSSQGAGGQSQTTTQTQVPSTASAAPQQPGMLGMVLPFVLMFVVIYFLIIRPQQKKVKEHQTLLDKIQHGDEVITSSGIFGTVSGVTEKICTLEIAQGVKIKVLKTQIANIAPKTL